MIYMYIWSQDTVRTLNWWWKPVSSVKLAGLQGAQCIMQVSSVDLSVSTHDRLQDGFVDETILVLGWKKCEQIEVGGAFEGRK